MFLGLPDPHPGFVTHKCESHSGSFHHEEKIVRKTLISTDLILLNDSLSLKNDVNVPVFRIRMFWGLLDPHLDLLGRGTDPDLEQNDTGPQH
jgi:hypothetical protein